MADSDPTYTIVTGKLSELLTKIRTTGVPGTVTTAWLESLGFKSSNDRSMLNVLKYIGFVDQAGKPTPAWQEYRGKDHKAVLGRAIKTAYHDLYAVYPNASELSNVDLGHFFSTKTTSGKAVVDKMVATFKALAAEAEFASDGNDGTPQQGHGDDAQQGSTHPANVVSHTPATANGLTVNINVQLTLPEGADEQTFEAFFKAMRNHLLTDTK